jgi:hypothetical protein
MFVGLAQAEGHNHKIATCSEDKPVAATCACGWKKAMQKRAMVPPLLQFLFAVKEHN